MFVVCEDVLVGVDVLFGVGDETLFGVGDVCPCGFENVDVVGFELIDELIGVCFVAVGLFTIEPLAGVGEDDVGDVEFGLFAIELLNAVGEEVVVVFVTLEVDEVVVFGLFAIELLNSVDVEEVVVCFDNDGDEEDGDLNVFDAVELLNVPAGVDDVEFTGFVDDKVDDVVVFGLFAIELLNGVCGAGLFVVELLKAFTGVDVFDVFDAGVDDFDNDDVVVLCALKCVGLSNVPGFAVLFTLETVVFAGFGDVDDAVLLNEFTGVDVDGFDVVVDEDVAPKCVGLSKEPGLAFLLTLETVVFVGFVVVPDVPVVPVVPVVVVFFGKRLFDVDWVFDCDCYDDGILP